MTDQVYGENIDPGDEIGPLTKNPDLSQVQAFLTAWTAGNDGAGAPVSVMGRFTDAETAASLGLPGPVLPGQMGQAFLAQLLTDWAGPAGHLRSLDVNFRRPVRHGEELKCLGLITDKQDDGDVTMVQIDVFIEDPRGDRPTQGVAEVIIPAHP